MEVVTIESQAYKDLVAKINAIAKFVATHQEGDTGNPDELWVDSYEVCTFLKISQRTLQRIRSKGEISYSRIRGRNFYKIGEIKRLLESRLIKSSKEHLKDLIANHKPFVKQKHNPK